LVSDVTCARHFLERLQEFLGTFLEKGLGELILLGVNRPALHHHLDRPRARRTWSPPVIATLAILLRDVQISEG